jgi:hypothetical protein
MTIPYRLACERCGRPAETVMAGLSAPALCDYCGKAATDEHEQARAQAGSPYEEPVPEPHADPPEVWANWC